MMSKNEQENEKHKPVGNAAAHAMTLDEAIAHAEDVADRCDTSCGREHQQLADWLKELRDMKSRNVGNAAAMREALETLLNLAWVVQDENSEGGPRTRVPEQFIIEVAKSALSEPARNCDLYATATEALKAQDVAFNEDNFKNGECRLGCPGCDDGLIDCKILWLFAPAAERKGECDA